MSEIDLNVVLDQVRALAKRTAQLAPRVNQLEAAMSLAIDCLMASNEAVVVGELADAISILQGALNGEEEDTAEIIQLRPVDPSPVQLVHQERVEGSVDEVAPSELDIEKGTNV